VGERKLAGLLIDQFQPGLAVVGIGINVRNRTGISRRQFVRPRRALQIWFVSRRQCAIWRYRCWLRSNRSGWKFWNAGPEQILPRVNALWDLPRRVQLDLDGRLVSGDFAGVDARGRLQLRLDDDRIKYFEPQDVKLLRDGSQITS
jgi:biotin-(acetyl-CoA carboxylase) ligase